MDRIESIGNNCRTERKDPIDCINSLGHNSQTYHTHHYYKSTILLNKNVVYTINGDVHLILLHRRYMAKIFMIQRKTLFNQYSKTV